MTSAAHPPVSPPSVVKQFYALTKPRVVQLIVFCALIGMVLAVPGAPAWAEIRLALLACAGIWLVAGAAAAFNCIVEKGIDAKYIQLRIEDPSAKLQPELAVKVWQ